MKASQDQRSNSLEHLSMCHQSMDGLDEGVDICITNVAASKISHVIWKADAKLVAVLIVVVIVLKELDNEADGHIGAADINISFPPIL